LLKEHKIRFAGFLDVMGNLATYSSCGDVAPLNENEHNAH